MSERQLIVALGARRYRVERPWGDLPRSIGRVTDVTVDMRGHLFVLMRYDPLVDAPMLCRLLNWIVPAVVWTPGVRT